jgi:hypothetical protein
MNCEVAPEWASIILIESPAAACHARGEIGLYVIIATLLLLACPQDFIPDFHTVGKRA